MRRKVISAADGSDPRILFTVWDDGTVEIDWQYVEEIAALPLEGQLSITTLRAGARLLLSARGGARSGPC